MLSSVLNGERAIQVNIAIMRAFVKLRQMLESNEELKRKFTAVIRKLATHDKYFTIVFDELKKLNEPATRNLRGLCASVVIDARQILTTEAQKAPRRHREIQKQGTWPFFG